MVGQHTYAVLFANLCLLTSKSAALSSETQSKEVDSKNHQKVHYPASKSNEVNMWFWGCYSGECSVVPDSIWSLIANKSIATGVFPGFGHAMHGGGACGIASEKATAEVAKLVSKAHAVNVTVRPLIEYWDKTSDAYKLFVRNITQQDNFIKMYVRDAVTNHYDGYNLDWEFGNFTSDDEKLMAIFLTDFAKALAPYGMQVSTCQGNMLYSNTQFVDESNYIGYSMGTYNSNFKEFLEQLGYGVSKWLSGGKSDAAHFGAGFSASSESWHTAPPTAADLRERFCALHVAGVSRISLFATQYLDQYLPFLQDFVSGKESFIGACLQDVIV